MNREIKFRAWDGKLWTTCGMFQGTQDGKKVFGISKHKDIIIMQYTGLKDKNGKEIYEGDILLCNDNKVYPVSFESGSFIIDNEPLCFDLEAEERQPMRVHPKDFATVIGNIYENPELINT